MNRRDPVTPMSVRDLKWALAMSLWTLTLWRLLRSGSPAGCKLTAKAERHFSVSAAELSCFLPRTPTQGPSQHVCIRWLPSLRRLRPPVLLRPSNVVHVWGCCAPPIRCSVYRQGSLGRSQEGGLESPQKPLIHSRGGPYISQTCSKYPSLGYPHLK